MRYLLIKARENAEKQPEGKSIVSHTWLRSFGIASLFAQFRLITCIFCSRKIDTGRTSPTSYLRLANEHEAVQSIISTRLHRGSSCGLISTRVSSRAFLFYHKILFTVVLLVYNAFFFTAFCDSLHCGAWISWQRSNSLGKNCRRRYIISRQAEVYLTLLLYYFLIKHIWLFKLKNFINSFSLKISFSQSSIRNSVNV